jgi:6-phosphofructokinase 1
MPFSLQLTPVPCKRLGAATFASPLRLAESTMNPHGRFIGEQEWVLGEAELNIARTEPFEIQLFEKAGPREHLYFNPQNTTAAIVTCGGLCPGLNDVIRSLYMGLHFNYRAARVLGIRNGYLGLNPQSNLQPIVLNEKIVDSIHHDGGTILGTSRGEQPRSEMVDFLIEQKIDILFCVGGDGTQRGAMALANEVAARGLRKAIIGIPKTIDNDLLYCDRSFGVVSAIEKAHEVVIQAHTEAKSTLRGIGLVKVMGRDAGYIACGAALASQEANYVLIPEVPFALEGERGLLAHLRDRLRARNHAVIVVAEGAGQSYFANEPVVRDKSGHAKKHDIGVYLKQSIGDYFDALQEPVDIKYIDPSYIVRSVPADSDDRILCDQLARHAIHAAMAGKTELVICYKNNKFMHVPMSLVAAGKQQVEVHGDLWSAVLATTGQPTQFVN